jgi:hypothetical protein
VGLVANAADRTRLLQFGQSVGYSSLSLAHDWQEWWREWGPKIAKDVGLQGWVLFILDADEKIRELHMLLSRVIRSKPAWETRGWSAAEWENVETITAAARAWFEKNCPNPDHVPEWAQFILSGQYGNFQALQRLGRELRALQEQGYNTIAVEARDDGTVVHSGGDRVLQELA